MIDLNKYKLFNYTSKGGKGTNPDEVCRSISDTTYPDDKTERYLNIVIGDNIAHKLGWKDKDRILFFQDKEKKEQFVLLKSKSGNMLRTTVGAVNFRTFRVQKNTKNAGLPIMTHGKCKDFEIAETEVEGEKIKCLVINL